MRVACAALAVALELALGQAARAAFSFSRDPDLVDEAAQVRLVVMSVLLAVLGAGVAVGLQRAVAGLLLIATAGASALLGAIGFLVTLPLVVVAVVLLALPSR